MNLFEEIAERNIKCELCGKPTIALNGGGWDNDRIYCTDRECSAEYVFPTTTISAEQQKAEDEFFNNNATTKK